MDALALIIGIAAVIVIGVIGVAAVLVSMVYEIYFKDFP